MEKVLGGIVVYNPKLTTLKETLTSLLANCSKVLVFRNSVLDVSIEHILVEQYTGRIEFIGSGRNVGLGEAHVYFLNYARHAKYDYLILSDQDSYYPVNYTESMLNFTCDDFCIVCPAWTDLNKRRNQNGIGQYFLSGNKIIFRTGDSFGNLSHGISSGMFINMKIIPEYIMPDSQFFIDWIDNDWCWRLISEGYVIGYNPNIMLKHDLGDNRSLLFGYTKRSAVRNYYIIRNLVFMIIKRSYKVRVKQYLLTKLCQHIFIVLFLSSGSFARRFSLVFNAFSKGRQGILGMKTAS